MNPFDCPPPVCFGPAEHLEPAVPMVGGLSFPPLPPTLFDLEADSPSRRIEQALAWAAEAQQLVVTLQERITYLETLTTTDELTGLLNRRGFFSHFRRELAHARRSGAAGGVVIMIDLDGFKAVNDSLGHDAGDAMLRRVADLLNHFVRGQDVVARLGGDEFAVLLTSVDAANGQARALDMARRLNGETVSWHGRTLPVTLSIGSAAYGPDDREDMVLRHADSAMYADKAARALPPRSCAKRGAARSSDKAA